MKTPNIPQKKMETLKYRRWTGMSIDTIGPFDKSVEGHHYGLTARHTQDENEEGEATNGSNFLIILGMTTKAGAPNAVLILIVGAPKRIHSDNAAEYSSEAMQQIYRTHNIQKVMTKSIHEAAYLSNLKTRGYTERDVASTKPLREGLDHESNRHRITG
jgi:hypothetical protein